MQSKANIKGTNTIKFIRREYVSAGRKATYGYFVVDIKAHKEETERTRLTVGGDQIEYTGDKSTRTASLTKAKMLFNINFFYLNTLPQTIRIYGSPDDIPPTRGDRQIQFKQPSG
jgi:hypothetical protein